MKQHNNSSILFFVILVTIAALASSASFWAPKLLSFISTNGNLIQALADFIQILLWITAVLLFLKKLSSSIFQASHTSPNNSATNNNRHIEDSTSSSKYGNSYSVKADRITGLIQGDNNTIDFHFNENSSNKED